MPGSTRKEAGRLRRDLEPDLTQGTRCPSRQVWTRKARTSTDGVATQAFQRAEPCQPIATGPPSRQSACAASVHGGHKAMVLVCLPLAAPIGLSPLHILTLCGSARVLVVSTEPLGDLSCLTGWLSQRRAVARAVDQVHPDARSQSMLGLPTPALTCAC